jgi:hypothetical protein
VFLHPAAIGARDLKLCYSVLNNQTNKLGLPLCLPLSLARDLLRVPANSARTTQLLYDGGAGGAGGAGRALPCAAALAPGPDLVHGCKELTATEELWATGLGTTPWVVGLAIALVPATDGTIMASSGALSAEHQSPSSVGSARASG